MSSLTEFSIISAQMRPGGGRAGCALGQEQGGSSSGAEAEPSTTRTMLPQPRACSRQEGLHPTAPHRVPMSLQSHGEGRDPRCPHSRGAAPGGLCCGRVSRGAEKDAAKAAWLPAKVLKEIIACIKIFTPAKGPKTFP